MFHFWQTPDHPFFGSRVRWSDFVCVQPRWTLFYSCVPYGQTLSCALLRWKDSAQTSIMRHWGCGVQSRVFLKGTKVRSQPSVKDLFPERKFFNILGGLRCLGKREVAPDTPERLCRSAEKRRKKCVNWLCSPGEQTVWQFPSARGTWQFSRARGHGIFYWDTTPSVLDASSKVCKLILLLHPHSWSELGHCTLCKTYVHLEILVISVWFVFSIIKQI